MLFFSKRIALTNCFYKWADENEAERTPENLVAFLVAKEILNEEKAMLYLKQEMEKEKAYLHVADIDAIPAADVAQVVHGKWLNTTKWWQGGSAWKRCSVCKKLDYKSNYCPNCGAKMDEGESNC